MCMCVSARACVLSCVCFECVYMPSGARAHLPAYKHVHALEAPHQFCPHTFGARAASRLSILKVAGQVGSS